MYLPYVLDNPVMLTIALNGPTAGNIGLEADRKRQEIGITFLETYTR